MIEYYTGADPTKWDDHKLARKIKHLLYLRIAEKNAK